MKIKILLQLVLALFSWELSAQDGPKTEVKAVVQNAQGEPVAGAVISEAGNKITVTDDMGQFTIDVNANSTLIISREGYQPISINANSQVGTVTLLPIVNKIPVAFQEVNRQDLPGGVSYLNVAELLEKNYYLGAGDNLSSLLPGLNGNIWGSNNLVLVDGVPREIGNILPTEIESITALKGAAAINLYGTDAAKGVLLITTKRGVPGLNRFNVRVNTGIFVPKIYPEYLGSAEYMTLYNEARRNDGLGRLPEYTDEAIYNSAIGTNPYRYPNVNYYAPEYVRKFHNRSDVTTEFTGGNEQARFYANMGYYHSNSLLKVGQGENEGVGRFHVRGNVDLKINDFITSQVNTSMAFYDTKTAKGNYWGNAATLRPNWYSPFVPVRYLNENDDASRRIVNNSQFLIDGQYLLGGRQEMQTTPFADLYTQGLEKYTARQFQSDAALKFDLASLVKGLTFTNQFGVDYYSRYYLNEDINTYALYKPNWNNAEGVDQITSLVNSPGAPVMFNEDKVSRDRNLDRSYQYQKLFFRSFFNYQNTFNEVHNVSGILVGNGYMQSISGEYQRRSNVNVGMQASYNFKHKYYVDLTGSVVHSKKLAPGHRKAFSPTASLGWRISEENFLRNSSVINDLKLTATAGVINTDMDISGYNMYQGVFAGGSAYRWNEGRQFSGTDIQRGENLNLTYLKRKEVSLGFETALFNRLIQINGSYFNIVYDGRIIRNTNVYPNYFSFGGTNFIPEENNDADLFTGFDIGASINKQIGKVGLNMGLVGTYATGKAIRRSENLASPQLSRIGKPLDGVWGLQSNGFFMNQAEIESHTPQAFGAVKAGDIRYIDQNNDGRVDANDEIYLGRSNPPLILGANFTAKWNNFTLFALVNGGFGANGVKSSDYFRVRQERKYSAVVRDRTRIGTDENGQWVVTELGAYPRLTTQSGDNNFRNSDYWLYSTNRVNLAKVQVSYDFPKRMFEGTIVNDLGVYVSGSDLLTIAKERKILETNIGGTPQTRFFNLGVKAAF